MQLTLNIYNKREIEKTYTADSYDLMFGTVEDILGVLDTITGEKKDKDDKDDKDDEIFAAITGAMGMLKPFLKDIFDGVTDEELRNVKVKELIPIFVAIVSSTFSEIKGAGSKNVRSLL